jgi:hypothetical protein
MSNFKDTVADAAKTVGQKVCDGAKQAAEFVKEKSGIGGPEVAGGADPGAIKPHMEVISSCGCRMGTVDHLEGGALKLTRKDSPDGQHHFLPVNWVARVDSHVHLNKNADETRQGWKADAASCAGCSA